ncbi:ribonuclease H-like domain-containing protein [Tanacetum coccineum]|uniref:Ribonuclease H-like domain-containing protein n=1 Tax=Tanacetum coccineum TaxID=301880 RepID=A0ABQ5APF7_9ASTR
MVRWLDDEMPRSRIPTLRRDLLEVVRFPRWVEAKVVSSEVESENWKRILLHQMCVAIDVATDGREEDLFPRNGKKPIGSKWVFRINYLSDSEIERYKARLVAKGFSQKEVTRRSISRYCVFVHGCLLSWKSKKHATLSRSSAEAKYRSMAAATCEVMWIVKIMKDLNVNNLITTNLYCDNKFAIQIAANLVMHEKTKHFDINVYLVREKVASGLIKTVKADSKENVTDILTKALSLSFSFSHSTSRSSEVSIQVSCVNDEFDLSFVY